MADSLTCRCKTFMQAKLEVSMDWDWHDWSIWSGGSSAGFSPTILSYSPVVPFSVRNHNKKLAIDCTFWSVVVAENSVCLIFFPANNLARHLIVALAVYEGLFDIQKAFNRHTVFEKPQTIRVPGSMFLRAKFEKQKTTSHRIQRCCVLLHAGDLSPSSFK